MLNTLSSVPCGNHESSTCVTLNGSGIQLAVGPQPLRLLNHNFGLAHRIMVKRLATSPHDPLSITDSACKKHLVVVGIQYGPFNTYIPIRSTTIGKSRVARDPIAMHTSWRSNSDITSVTRQTHLPKTNPVLWPEIYHTIVSSDNIGYPHMKASDESSTTKHRLLHASGPHPIPPPNDPKGVGKRVKVRRLSCRVSMTFRVVRTNQYNQYIARSVRLSEEVTRVSQHFGALTISFSRCACERDQQTLVKVTVAPAGGIGIRRYGDISVTHEDLLALV
ncbi:hypothetical protein F511_12223 [Dorcoceras hygrometricum]|uniref:Uncharacterized protein n=1 Tax=Dorcoceras hygrometricum TaxID=472368 RepID=A0A2Z7D1U9_9LAMI|nr:hypothetical protein F511_12223 [Dorcoceras hygrometricum]